MSENKTRYAKMMKLCWACVGFVVHTDKNRGLWYNFLVNFCVILGEIILNTEMQKKIHKFVQNGMYILLDVNSGAVHVID